MSATTTAQKRRTQAERREEAERAILEAATRIVAAKGLDELTLADAGEAAGYSRGLPSHYFGSKAELLSAIANHIFEWFFAGLRARAKRRPGLDSLIDGIEFFFDVCASDRVMWIAMAIPVRIDGLVRERFAFTCDVGTRRADLERAWPQHDFTALEEVWWPHRRETEAEVIARAARFRTAMRALPEAAETLLVSHWGFILALTGRSVANGDWLQWDPHGPAPSRIDWA